MSLLNSFPKCVHVVEMLPRDGFQRLDELVPADEKVEIIDALSDTGVDGIKLSSFIHPRAVPTLRDADEVTTWITRHDGATYRALVPNLQGMKHIVEAEVDKMNAPVTVSETCTSKNQNCTREEMLAEMGGVVDPAHDHGIEVEVGMGTSFYCPYEGIINSAETLAVVDNVVDPGVDEVTLVATVGLANPVEIIERLTVAFKTHPGLDMGLHPRDTNEMSLANTLAAMTVGVDRLDASTCGLSGSVVLPGDMSDVGNTPTEDLVQTLEHMGAGHGINFGHTRAATHDASDRLSLGLTNYIFAGGTVKDVLDTIAAGGEAD